MHELGITQEVVEAVCARTQGRPVSRVVVAVGRLSGILPDAFRSCFELCSEGGPLHGTALEILEEPGHATCRACGSDVELQTFFGYCKCGSSDLDWRDGDTVRVLRIEVKPEE